MYESRQLYQQGETALSLYMFALYFISLAVGEDVLAPTPIAGRGYGYWARMMERAGASKYRALRAVLDAQELAVKNHEMVRRIIDAQDRWELLDDWRREGEAVFWQAGIVAVSSDGRIPDTLQYSYLPKELGRTPRQTWTELVRFAEKLTVFTHRADWRKVWRTDPSVAAPGNREQVMRYYGMVELAKPWFRKNPPPQEADVPHDRVRTFSKINTKLPWGEARDLSELDEFTGFVINEDGTFNSTKGRRKLTDPILPDVLNVDRLETIIQEYMCPLGEDGHAYVYELACELMTMLKAAKFEDVIRRPYGIPGLASIIKEIGIIATIRGFEDYYLPVMLACEPGRAVNDTYDRANRQAKGTKHYVFDPDDDEELDSNDYVYAYKVLTSLDSVDHVTHTGAWSKVFARSMEVLDFGRTPMGANTLEELDTIRLALNEINNPATREAGLFSDPSGRGVEYFWLHWQRRMRTIVHRAATWQVYGPNRTMMGDLFRSFMEIRDTTTMWLPRNATMVTEANGLTTVQFIWKPSEKDWNITPMSVAENLNRVRRYVLANDLEIVNIDVNTDGDDSVTHFIDMR